MARKLTEEKINEIEKIINKKNTNYCLIFLVIRIGMRKILKILKNILLDI